MIKYITLLTALLLLTSQNAYPWGALALGNRDNNYGYSYNYHSKRAAMNRALFECGNNCEIVVVFDGGCAAFASEEGEEFPYGSGWSTHSLWEAKRIALNYCWKNGGVNCRIKVWACESDY